MGFSLPTFIATIINFGILVVIIVALYKLIQGIKDFVNRNKRLEEKVDAILKKLEDKNDI